MSSTQKVSTYNDIDWHQLWQNARTEKSWKSKTADDWSNTAISFGQRVRKTPYIRQLLSLLDIDRDSTILDVGCGPGTLAIPLAGMVKAVTAIDYSDGMIAEVKREAKERNLDNINALNCSWEDNWDKKHISVHDIAIASRSMNITNLEEGIRKLDNHAAKQVIITDRIAPSPFDPDVFKALGRDFNSGPDYIYTVNTLYKLGIHPRIEHIELAAEVTYPDMDDALNSYLWMLKNVTKKEEKLLADFLTDRVVSKNNNQVVIKKRFPQKWAVISWKKQPVI